MGGTLNDLQNQSIGGIGGQISDTTHTSGVCPNCGYCKCCGRGGVYTYPATYPYNPWYHYFSFPYTWNVGTNGLTYEVPLGQTEIKA